jgi:hypothetical protein
VTEFPNLPSITTNTGSTDPVVTQNADLTSDAQLEDQEVVAKDQAMDDNSQASYSAFTILYPQDYPPDWSISPANYYIKPFTKDIDAIDSALIQENERRIALCLAPFSKEFFIATGYSKVQLPEDYLELTRVIIWQNRQRLKRGLSVLNPREFVEFLFVEMAQDFKDLGIEIQDFLDDLIKIRHSENIAFDTYNNYIQYQKSNSSRSNLDSISEYIKKENPATTSPDKYKKQSASSSSPNKLPPTNLLKKFLNVSDTDTPQSSVIDKPIILKNKETRRHIHRYDLRIGIKECRTEEEEQKVLQALLEEFFDTMLSADKTILIPPYYELDRANTNFQDLSISYKIADTESFSKLKRYFSRLGNRNQTTGFVYCSCIIATSEPHTTLMIKVSQILQETKLSLWPRSCDHENVGRIGWLLYSLQDMDAVRLKTLLTNLTGTEIGVKWMKISTDYGSKKGRTNTNEEPTKALVLDGPQDQAYELRDILSTWYGSKSTSFPDAVRMRLIPPIDVLTDANRQENYGAALAKQASFVSKMGKICIELNT